MYRDWRRQIPGLPGAPSNLVVVPNSDVGLGLTWTDNSSNETSFRVERGTDGINFVEVGSTAANTPNFADSGLTQNTLYYYRVKARNGFGDSAYTIIAAATTYDHDAYVDISNGDILSNTEKNAINAIVLGLKADSLWSKISVGYLMSGSGFDPLLGIIVDMKGGVPGVPANSSSGYISYQGYAFEETSNNYWDTAVVPSDDPLITDTSFHMSFYKNSADYGAEKGETFMGVFNTTSSNSLSFNASYSPNSSLTFDYGGYDSSTASVDYGPMSESGLIGFYVITRTSGSILKLFKDGTEISSNLVADLGLAPTDYSVFLGALNIGGTAGQNITSTCGFFSIGLGLDDTEVANLTARNLTYQTALGRNF